MILMFLFFSLMLVLMLKEEIHRTNTFINVDKNVVGVDGNDRDGVAYTRATPLSIFTKDIFPAIINNLRLLFFLLP